MYIIYLYLYIYMHTYIHIFGQKYNIWTKIQTQYFVTFLHIIKYYVCIMVTFTVLDVLKTKSNEEYGNTHAHIGLSLSVSVGRLTASLFISVSILPAGRSFSSTPSFIAFTRSRVPNIAVIPNAARMHLCPHRRFWYPTTSFYPFHSFFFCLMQEHCLKWYCIGRLWRIRDQ